MKHLSSFILSVFIHIIILFLIILTYTSLKNILADTKKEKILPIKLNKYIPSQYTIHQTKKIRKTQKLSQNKKKTIKKHKKYPKRTKIIQKQKKVIHKILTNKNFQSNKTISQKTPKKTKIIQKQKKVIHKILTNKNFQSNKTISQKTPKKTTSQITSYLQKINQKEKKHTYIKDYIQDNIHKIKKLIEQNLYYPRKARRRHIEGKVILKVTISKNGKILHIDTISSDHDVLTHAAKQIFILIEDQIPKPKEKITLTVPISYKLH